LSAQTRYSDSAEVSKGRSVCVVPSCCSVVIFNALLWVNTYLLKISSEHEVCLSAQQI
jgi:hypothetical protein